MRALSLDSNISTFSVQEKFLYMAPDMGGGHFGSQPRGRQQMFKSPPPYFPEPERIHHVADW
jgi:hypothetical protein